MNQLVIQLDISPEDDQSIETSSCNQLFTELITTQKITSTWCHRKQSLLINYIQQLVGFSFNHGITCYLGA